MNGIAGAGPTICRLGERSLGGYGYPALSPMIPNPRLYLAIKGPAANQIRDMSGNGYHGTLNGGTAWGLSRGGVWHPVFNGLADYVLNSNNNNLVNPVGAFSILAYVYNTAGGAGTIYAEGESVNGWPYFRLYCSTVSIGIVARNDVGANIGVSSANGATAAAWHLIGINCDGAGTYRFHIDSNHYAETADTMAGTFANLIKWSVGALVRVGVGDYFGGRVALCITLPASLSDNQFSSVYYGLRDLF